MSMWHGWLRPCVSSDDLATSGLGGGRGVGRLNAGCIGGGSAPARTARIGKDDCGAEIDELDDVTFGEDAVVELEISVGKTE